MDQEGHHIPRLILPLIGLVAIALQAQSPNSASAIQPFLTKHCATCHNDTLATANLSLAHYPNDPATRQKILDKITTGRMPPPGAPAPAKPEIAAVTEALKQTLLNQPSDTDRVTAHRLNRVEYNNTIRDLLHVSLHPADEFPLDDAGYGFDNIGDVLSVSPLLMEKYATAARAVSREAIYGAAAPDKPTKLIRFLGKKSQDDPTANALPFSLRGALWTTFNFPADGEYEFRMRVGNYRPRLRAKSYPNVGMAFQLDGKTIYTEIVDGDIDTHYAHGESIARAALTAGEHSFRAEFPEFANTADPLDNMNKDGRRKLFTDYIDIVGPFNAAHHPPASRAIVFICTEKTPACARTILANLARRAFRRPPAAAELNELTALAAHVRKDGKPFDESIRVALQAILMSPNFLFRMDRANDDYALASRIAYFLWSSMPDDELLRAAAAHNVKAQLPRMMSDAKSEALIDNFVAQWLGLRLLDKRKPDPKHFPLADDEILDAMRSETTLFARALLRENRSVFDFLDAPFTYLNGPLAHYYGIPGINGDDFQRVDLTGQKRGGVLTQGAILTLSSYATRTSPVLRGKWVLENMLGTAPPPPPPGVPSLPENILGKDASVRQRLEQHRADPACAVCHNQMDPIGFGLENFDAAGAWRDKEGDFAIEGPGPDALKRDLRQQSDQFARNLTEKLLTYALGRGLEPADRPAVDKIIQRAGQNGFRFSDLVKEVVNAL